MKIQVISNTASTALQRQLQALTSKELAARVGPVCQALTEQHLAALKPNKKGWPSTGFYKKFVPNVRWEAVENGVAITILPVEVNGRSVSLAQRRYGGPILPVKGRFLAYPISPLSYGKLPGDFPGLFVLRTSKCLYLAQSLHLTRQRIGPGAPRGVRSQNRTRNTLQLLFRLAPGVLQLPDPSVLPTNEKYLNAVANAIRTTNSKN